MNDKTFSVPAIRPDRSRLFRNTSIRTRLYAIVALSLAMLMIFAAIGVHGIREGSQALSTVYEHQVQPRRALLEVERALKEIRFRMAGYALHQHPAVGNRIHLNEARQAIPGAWQDFKQKSRGNDYSPEQRKLISMIDKNIGALPAFFEKLDQTYALDDSATIAAILEDEWPYAVHVTVLKPVSQLIPFQEALVANTYDAYAAEGRRLIVTGLSLFVLLTVVLIWYVGRIAASITRPLDAAVNVANRIAHGDLGSRIEADPSNELGQLLAALDNMREQVHTRQERLETILDNAAEGIVTFDIKGAIKGYNRAAEKLFGWTEQEVLGAHIGSLLQPDSMETRENYHEHFMRTELARLIGREGEMNGRHKDGSTFPLALKISRMMLQGREVYVALAADISERKALIEDLKRMAEHDGLTGLHNRSFFMGELERVIERARRTKEPGAVLYLDLDNFKYINDVHGHAAGDQLLIEVANILRRRGRKSDLIARLGGDEFAVLLYNIPPDRVAEVAESFRKSLSDSVFRQGTVTANVACSIGAAMIAPQTESAAQVMSYADIASHMAKRLGRNRIHVFESADAENAATMALDMGWSQRIKEAIENNRFALACQPIVNTHTREVESYEVLIRMLDDKDTLIMPAGFLPPAERFGLMVDIDKWVITHAIDTLVQQRRELPKLRYSINLSGQSLSDHGICDLIQAKLAAAGLDPAALTFEVTETVAIADMGVAAAFLTRLRLLGCRTALDDFGSGMSSFAYLQDLPVDTIKIDGRFVKNLDTNPVDQAMVRAMSEIARALGKQTVAEFVENEKSFKLLAKFGVDYGQGYHLGRPDVILPCKAISGQAGEPGLCIL
ncbi:MAG: EAL domain-containing protein [Gallionella sp.]|nr:EAL domain-containing protein [Gallionella sp.]